VREMKMRRHNLRCVRLMVVMICVGLMSATSTVVKSSLAQGQSAKKTETDSQSKQVKEPVQLRAQLKQAGDEFKSNLERLLVLYEADAKRAEEQLPKMKELLAQGLVTRGEVQTAEDAAARAREKVVGVQGQLRGADTLIAEAFVEAETEDSPRNIGRSSAQRPISTLVRTTAYIRYGGAHAWSLSQADVIRQFFIRRFGRALPVGAFGQSALHDRWGYDHRNAMDVGISPDSAEGQILMDYLRANGIPFTAFHFAVPGKATGPHIHVGLPSHRIVAVAGGERPEDITSVKMEVL